MTPQTRQRRRVAAAFCALAATAVAMAAVGAVPATAATATVPTAAPSGPTVEFTPPAVEHVPPADVGRDNGAGVGWWDLGGRVREAINGWLREVVTSALTPVLDLLARTILATPQVAGPGRVADLWGVSRAIANTVFVLFVLVGGTVVMGYETIQTRYTAKDIAPRLVLAMVAANFSLWLSGQAITIANALSRGLLGDDVAVGDLATRLSQLVAVQAATAGTALLLVGAVAAVLAVVVVAVYVIRVAVIVLLVAAAPMALACHALPHTDAVARLWWRALTACLAIQIGQALAVVTGVQVFLAPDGSAIFGLDGGGTLVDLLVIVCLLWLLVRIPIWATRAVFTGRGGILVRTAKYYVAARTVRAVLSR